MAGTEPSSKSPTSFALFDHYLPRLIPEMSFSIALICPLKTTSQLYHHVLRKWRATRLYSFEPLYSPPCVLIS